ncbi:hypothetical protein CWM32_24705 [Escherichia coli]|nr:hypothetical protein CWM32_24705 [Escherichia coli]
MDSLIQNSLACFFMSGFIFFTIFPQLMGFLFFARKTSCGLIFAGQWTIRMYVLVQMTWIQHISNQTKIFSVTFVPIGVCINVTYLIM